MNTLWQALMELSKSGVTRIEIPQAHEYAFRSKLRTEMHMGIFDCPTEFKPLGIEFVFTPSGDAE